MNRCLQLNKINSRWPNPNDLAESAGISETSVGLGDFTALLSTYMPFIQLNTQFFSFGVHSRLTSVEEK
jgi:hypothetical protein